jgi:hypothetical protein
VRLSSSHRVFEVRCSIQLSYERINVFNELDKCCVYRKLNPDVMMMKSAEYRA